MTDWATINHVIPEFLALEGQTILVRSKFSDKYLGFSCVDGDCALEFSGALRGTFTYSKEEATSNPNCQFILRNFGAGYFLVSVATNKPIHALRSQWFTDPLWERAISDSTRPISSGDELLISRLHFVAKVDGGSKTPLPDGNYNIVTVFRVMYSHPYHIASRSEGKLLTKKYIVTGNAVHDTQGGGNRWSKFELISTGDIGRDDPVETGGQDLFVLETVKPPDLKKWLSDDKNQLLCVEGKAEGKTLTYCGSLEARGFMGETKDGYPTPEGKSVRDKWMADYKITHPDPVTPVIPTPTPTPSPTPSPTPTPTPSPVIPPTQDKILGLPANYVKNAGIFIAVVCVALLVGMMLKRKPSTPS